MRCGRHEPQLSATSPRSPSRSKSNRSRTGVVAPGLDGTAGDTCDEPPRDHAGPHGTAVTAAVASRSTRMRSRRSRPATSAKYEDFSLVQDQGQEIVNSDPFFAQPGTWSIPETAARATESAYLMAKGLSSDVRGESRAMKLNALGILGGQGGRPDSSDDEAQAWGRIRAGAGHVRNTWRAARRASRSRSVGRSSQPAARARRRCVRVRRALPSWGIALRTESLDHLDRWQRQPFAA
jgi:hypothetical protein